MIPKLGSMVHYVYSQGRKSKHLPAVVISVTTFPKRETTEVFARDHVSLQVFGIKEEGAAYIYAAFPEKVLQDEVTRNPGTWHWPEE